MVYGPQMESVSLRMSGVCQHSPVGNVLDEALIMFHMIARSIFHLQYKYVHRTCIYVHACIHVRPWHSYTVRVHVYTCTCHVTCIYMQCNYSFPFFSLPFPPFPFLLPSLCPRTPHPHYPSLSLSLLPSPFILFSLQPTGTHIHSHSQSSWQHLQNPPLLVPTLRWVAPETH